MKVPGLHTERLRMRGWRDSDLDAWAAIASDVEVMRWVGDADGMDREEAWLALGDDGIGPGEGLGAPVDALHRQLTFEGRAGHEVRGAPDRHREPGHGRCAGHAGRGCVEGGRPCSIRLAGTDAQHPGELEPGRDALHLADEHVRRGHHGERRLHVWLRAGAGDRTSVV